MTWVKIAPGVEAAYSGTIVYLMVKNRSAGKANRWDLISVATKFTGATFLGRELPPGQCRRYARVDAGLT